MLLKKLCFKQSTVEKTTCSKKGFNEKKYSKNLINNSLLFDSSSSIINVTPEMFSTSRTILPGRSFLLRDFVFRSRFNSKLVFKSSIKTNQVRFLKSSYILKFSLLLDLVNNLENKQLLILLNPKKGGFNCFSSGVFGFLPRSHSKFIFLEIYSFIKKKLKVFLKFYFDMVLFNTVLNPPIKLFFSWGSIAFYLSRKKRKFSKAKKIKHFFMGLNVVFLRRASTLLVGESKTEKKENEGTKK